MISGVRAASIDNEAGTVVTQSTQDSSGSNSGGNRPSGDSGSIGNIFRSRNKRRRNNWLLEVVAIIIQIIYNRLFNNNNWTRRIMQIQSFSTTLMRSPSMSVSANTKNKALPLTQQQIEEGCRLGIDSHADMTCVGAHAKILEIYEGQLCNVQPFNDSYE